MPIKLRLISQVKARQEIKYASNSLWENSRSINVYRENKTTILMHQISSLGIISNPREGQSNCWTIVSW